MSRMVPRSMSEILLIAQSRASATSVWLSPRRLRAGRRSLLSAADCGVVMRWNTSRAMAR